MRARAPDCAYLYLRTRQTVRDSMRCRDTRLTVSIPDCMLSFQASPLGLRVSAKTEMVGLDIGEQGTRQRHQQHPTPAHINAYGHPCPGIYAPVRRCSLASASSTSLLSLGSGSCSFANYQPRIRATNVAIVLCARSFPISKQSYVRTHTRTHAARTPESARA